MLLLYKNIMSECSLNIQNFHYIFVVVVAIQILREHSVLLNVTFLCKCIENIIKDQITLNEHSNVNITGRT